MKELVLKEAVKSKLGASACLAKLCSTLTVSQISLKNSAKSWPPWISMSKYLIIGSLAAISVFDISTILQKLINICTQEHLSSVCRPRICHQALLSALQDANRRFND